MTTSPGASHILDVVTFLRAAQVKDGLAMQTLMEDGNAQSMLIALAGLLITDVPNLPAVLEEWHRQAMDVALGDLPGRGNG